MLFVMVKKLLLLDCKRAHVLMGIWMSWTRANKVIAEK